MTESGDELPLEYVVVDQATKRIREIWARYGLAMTWAGGAHIDIDARFGQVERYWLVHDWSLDVNARALVVPLRYAFAAHAHDYSFGSRRQAAGTASATADRDGKRPVLRADRHAARVRRNDLLLDENVSGDAGTAMPPDVAFDCIVGRIVRSGLAPERDLRAAARLQQRAREPMAARDAVLHPQIRWRLDDGEVRRAGERRRAARGGGRHR
ncbi:MAG TPA: hypothetical protein VK665_01770 [Candidatus Elarobacter sp.]|nr:hypothetical protein [Candidatus Elarobacter sp.]